MTGRTMDQDLALHSRDPEVIKRAFPDERDVVADVHGRSTVAATPVIALGVDEGAAYVKLQNAAARVKRLEAELTMARQETAQALGEWSQFAKEQR